MLAMNGPDNLGLRRQAERDAAFGRSQKRCRAALAAAVQNARLCTPRSPVGPLFSSRLPQRAFSAKFLTLKLVVFHEQN